MWGDIYYVVKYIFGVWGWLVHCYVLMDYVIYDVMLFLMYVRNMGYIVWQGVWFDVVGIGLVFHRGAAIYPVFFGMLSLSV